MEGRAAKRRRRPNWLPDGWLMGLSVTDRGKEVKHYTCPVSGRTFYSKQEVLYYLKVTYFDDLEDDRPSAEENQAIVATQGSHPLEWLPHGWILEIKTRITGDHAGKVYKSYFHRRSGSRFYSEAEVLHFLKLGNLSNPTSEGCSEANSTDNILAQVEHSPEGLPHGWIKETIFRKSKTKILRKDAYYVDPATGYAFRSMKDATRFVETGEVSKHANGPRRKDFTRRYNVEVELPESL